MPQTVIRGSQILNNTVQRQDLDVTTVGQAVATKIIQGTNVVLSSTGADSGTGDVTISVPTGGAGPVGPTGPAGENANTITSAGFTVPPVGSTVTVNVADTGWMVVGQMLYVDTAGGGAGIAGAFQVTAKTSTTVTLLNVAQAPATPPLAAVGQAGLLAALSGRASDYVGGDNACHALPTATGFVSKTGTYTVTPADAGNYIICTGGSWTLTLPSPVLGFNVSVRNDMGISGVTGTITVTAPSGTINGLATLALLPQQECLLVCDGTNWRTRGLQREVILGTQDITSATANGTVLLPVGFRYFELDWEGLVPVTTSNYLAFQLSINGGSTWISANYYFSNILVSAVSAVAASTQQGIASANIGPTTANAFNQGNTVRLSLWPGSASQNARWRSQGGGYSTFEQEILSTGMLNAGGAVNALLYFFGAGGNIANSFLTVRGVV